MRARSHARIANLIQKKQIFAKQLLNFMQCRKEICLQSVKIRRPVAATDTHRNAFRKCFPFSYYFRIGISKSKQHACVCVRVCISVFAATQSHVSTYWSGLALWDMRLNGEAETFLSKYNANVLLKCNYIKSTESRKRMENSYCRIAFGIAGTHQE